jgi:hypothetical protein
VTAPETLPNMLRATALIAWTTHGPSCPDHADHNRAVELLVRVADAVETGGPLRAGERDAAVRTARGYLADREPAEVAA